MKIVNTTLKVLLYTTKNKNKINLTNHFSNVMTYSILLGGKSWFRIFKMIFCSIKINTTQFSNDLFVWLVKTKTSLNFLMNKFEQLMNFRNAKPVSGNVALYHQKWCPVITRTLFDQEVAEIEQAFLADSPHPPKKPFLGFCVMATV